MIWLRMGIRELFRNKGFCLFFTVNLAVGLCGFIAVRSFSHSLDRHLEKNLKEILTADLVLTSNTPLTDAEIEAADRILGPDKSVARHILFYSMIRTQKRARLMQVMAVDAAFPLYGSFNLEKGGPAGSRDLRQAQLQDRPSIYLSRDTAFALGVRDAEQETQPVRIGDKDFFIADYFNKDPDAALTGMELAPRVYLGIDQVEETGLIKFGSRIRYFTYFRFPEGVDVPGLAAALKKEFALLSPDNHRVNVFDSRDVNRRLERVTGYFTGYMALVSLVALFLAGIAAAYLFRAWLGNKLKEIAILMSIGAGRAGISVYLFSQVLALGVLAAFLALGFALVLMPAFPAVFADLMPAGLEIRMDLSACAMAVGLGAFGSLFFCLPVLVRALGVTPLALLRGSRDPGGQNKIRLAAAFLPGILLFVAGAVAVAGYAGRGLIFCGGLVLALMLFSGAAWIGGRICRTLSGTRHLVRRLAFRNLYRNQWTSLACFVTIAMGVFLISLIPQIQKGLSTEINRPKGFKLPVFFLIDIQAEQAEALTEFMADRPGTLAKLSPMVQGRIITVNGQPFKGRLRHRSADDPNNPRRLEYIFSYRKHLDPSETIVRGEPLPATPWDFESGELFGISAEEGFAKDHGLKLGDRLRVDVQGIELQGRIMNIRDVKWNSFQPNFFLLFQDGVVNEAPKTYLAIISDVPPENRQDLKVGIVEKFPNISVLDVTQTLATLTTITDRLSLSVRFMALLAIAAGLVSVFSIARHQVRQQSNQINLLKVLGCDFRDIRRIILVEFGSLGFAAALTAVILSIAFSRAISWYLFDSLWQLDLAYLAAILVLTTGICILTSLAASRRILGRTPLALLQGT